MKHTALVALLVLVSQFALAQAADSPQKQKYIDPWRKVSIIERFIPGITFQLQNHAGYLLDANPMIMYRLRPRFSIGAGWIYRIALNHGYHRGRARVYGPRVALQYNWRKGISLRLLPELMNTAIDPAFVSGGTMDHQHIWIWGVFAGVKKDFVIHKMIRGNVEGLYNFLEQGVNSPYGDRFAVRFGFEFPLKKKGK